MSDLEFETVRAGKLAKIVFAMLIGWSVAVYAQERKVPAELWQDVQSKGTVRVIVMLNVPPRDEERIAMAQNQLLSELEGTTYRVNGRFKYIPGIGLTVTSDGLAVLERSLLVKQVTEDSPSYPHSSRTDWHSLTREGKNRIVTS